MQSGSVLDANNIEIYSYCHYITAKLEQRHGTRGGRLVVRCAHSLLILLVKSVLSHRFIHLKAPVSKCEVVEKQKVAMRQLFASILCFLSGCCYRLFRSFLIDLAVNGDNRRKKCWNFQE